MDVAQVVFEFICFYTTKLLLPLFTLGRVRVPFQGPRHALPRGSSTAFWYPLPGGGIGLYPDAAMIIGMMIWIVLAFLALVVWAFLR